VRSRSWELIAAWVFFLIAIACGLLYQWLSMRRLWDQYDMGHRTIENKDEPGYRITPRLLKIDQLNLSWVWLGMTGTFYSGAVLFVIYAAMITASGKSVPPVAPKPSPTPAKSNTMSNGHAGQRMAFLFFAGTK